MAASQVRGRATAAFNLNLLQRLRAELDCDIDPTRFEHRAFFNARESRIEMHLVSTEPQTVHLEGETFHFEAGETLHTENSYKYSLESFCVLARCAGFECAGRWTDEDGLFSVHYLRRN